MRLHVDDLVHLVLPRRDDEDVEPAETAHRVGDDRIAIGLGRAAPVDRRDIGPELAAGRGDRVESLLVAAGDRDLGASAGEHFGGQGAERAGRADNQRALAANVEERERIAQEVAHGLTPGG